MHVRSHDRLEGLAQVASTRYGIYNAALKVQGRDFNPEST